MAAVGADTLAVLSILFLCIEQLPLTLETSLPGVFAVGGVREHSVKRVASAVGEGSISIQQVHEYLSRVRP